MKKFSCIKIKYFPADSVEGAKIINKNLSKEFGFKVALDGSKSMKGGHRHNHIYNKCHKHVFRSKLARKNVDREDKKEFVRIFYIGLKLNRNFGEFLHKIFHKNNQSTAQ